MAISEISKEEYEAFFAREKDSATKSQSVRELIDAHRKSAQLPRWAKILIVSLLILSGIGIIYLAFCIKLIPEGQIGISSNAGRPAPLGPGWHLLLSPFHTMREEKPKVSVTEPVIDLTGGATLLTVLPGQVAITVKGVEYELLGAGRYLLDDGQGTHRFVRFANLSSTAKADREIPLGDRTLVRVLEGEVGVVFDNTSETSGGQPAKPHVETLHAGKIHDIRGNGYLFGGFFSTQQQVIPVKIDKINTLNNLSITVEGDVMYEIKAENVPTAISKVMAREEMSSNGGGNNPARPDAKQTPTCGTK